MRSSQYTAHAPRRPVFARATLLPPVYWWDFFDFARSLSLSLTWVRRYTFDGRGKCITSWCTTIERWISFCHAVKFPRMYKYIHLCVYTLDLNLKIPKKVSSCLPFRNSWPPNRLWSACLLSAVTKKTVLVCSRFRPNLSSKPLSSLGNFH